MPIWLADSLLFSPSLQWFSKLRQASPASPCWQFLATCTFSCIPGTRGKADEVADGGESCAPVRVGAGFQTRPYEGHATRRNRLADFKRRRAVLVPCGP